MEPTTSITPIIRVGMDLGIKGQFPENILLNIFLQIYELKNLSSICLTCRYWSELVYSKIKILEKAIKLLFPKKY